MYKQEMNQAPIHSFETFGTVDGPGIRFVLFLHQCPLRCLYCHNPDSWSFKQPRMLKTARDVFHEIVKYKSFYQPSGGVTFSGGEPMLHIPFLAELAAMLKKEGMHIALDTSGAVFLETNAAQIDFLKNAADLVLLDIKAFDSNLFKKLTGGHLQPVLNAARFLAKIHKPVWLRYVLVPDYTDDKKQIEELASFSASLGNIELVEVLPFHKAGEFKWRELGLRYELTAVPAPALAQAEEVRTIFRSKGLLAR